ncbi:phage head closure protein [Pantoea ananatis]
MEPGRLRHRVTVQNAVQVKLPSGQPKDEWHAVATGLPAEVKGISGREIVASGAEKAEATIRVWMRYRSDITAASRLVCETGPYRGYVLDVIGIPIADNRMTRLEILCKQGVKT